MIIKTEDELINRKFTFHEKNFKSKQKYYYVGTVQ